MRLSLGADAGEERLRHGGRQGSVAVVGEGRGMKDRLIEWQTDEPAQQQIVAELVDQAPLGADRVDSEKV
jgi:hypothetical protein